MHISLQQHKHNQTPVSNLSFSNCIDVNKMKYIQVNQKKRLMLMIYLLIFQLFKMQLTSLNNQTIVPKLTLQIDNIITKTKKGSRITINKNIRRLKNQTNSSFIIDRSLKSQSNKLLFNQHNRLLKIIKLITKFTNQKRQKIRTLRKLKLKRVKKRMERNKSKNKSLYQNKRKQMNHKLFKLSRLAKINIDK